jgi:DNA-directed RNA polymerase sigma subunit (sigma70/sigma32)
VGTETKSTVNKDKNTRNKLSVLFILGPPLYKVLATLPDKEQMVLTVCFGLDGKGLRNDREAGRELGISNEGIGNIKRRALIYLSLPPRRNYLQDIYLDNPRVSIDNKWELNARYSKKIVLKNRDYIEDFLIRQMDKDELAELINKIPSEYRSILTLTYGLADGIEHNKSEICAILNLSISNVYIKTNEGRDLLRALLEKSYNKKYRGTIDKDYLDYMMDEYMQRGYKKNK